MSSAKRRFGHLLHALLILSSTKSISDDRGRPRLIRLVFAERQYVIVEEGQVVGRDGEVRRCQRDEHGAVRDIVVWGAIKDSAAWLDCGSGAVRCDVEGGVRHVELGDPSSKPWRGGVYQTANRGVVRVVVGHRLSRSIPAELDHLAWFSQGRAVVGYISQEAGHEEIGIIDDVEPRVDLPLDMGVRSWTGDDIAAEQRPRHGLGNSSLEIDRHRKCARELPKDQLLSSFSRYALQKQLR